FIFCLGEISPPFLLVIKREKKVTEREEQLQAYYRERGGKVKGRRRKEAAYPFTESICGRNGRGGFLPFYCFTDLIEAVPSGEKHNNRRRHHRLPRTRGKEVDFRLRLSPGSCN
ncbi:unnamed protein product, partial [Linum tenue]